MVKEVAKRPHPIDVIVGKNLRTYRQLAKLSQSDLGDSLGVTFQQIQKYENASNRISASRLWRLSKILHIPIQDFFGELNGK